MKRPTEVLHYWHNPAEIIEALQAGGYSVVPTAPLQAVFEAASSYWDRGPHGEGWQSDELKAACSIVGDAISEKA